MVFIWLSFSHSYSNFLVLWLEIKPTRNFIYIWFLDSSEIKDFNYYVLDSNILIWSCLHISKSFYFDGLIYKFQIYEICLIFQELIKMILQSLTWSINSIDSWRKNIMNFHIMKLLFLTLIHNRHRARYTWNRMGMEYARITPVNDFLYFLAFFKKCRYFLEIQIFLRCLLQIYEIISTKASFLVGTLKF